MENSALHNQRRGNKSGKLQAVIIDLAAKHAGYTIDQLSWIAAGFSVDEQGFCQPAELYSQVQRYFNGKRRGSEVAKSQAEITALVNGDDPAANAKLSKTKLVYIPATRNPYTEAAGKGVRLYRAGGASMVDHGLDALPVAPAGERVAVGPRPVPSIVPDEDGFRPAVQQKKPFDSVANRFDPAAQIANLNDMLED